MHRDKKIGFALGILLIGLVAAFFFRNEPDPFAELPPLDDPAALDAQIAEKAIAPYTQDLNPHSQPVHVPSRTDQWAMPEIYRSGNAPSTQSEGLPRTPGAPAPIDLVEPLPAPNKPSAPNRVIDVGNPFGAVAPINNQNTGSPLPGNEGWTTVPPHQPRPAQPAPTQPGPAANVVKHTLPATPPKTAPAQNAPQATPPVLPQERVRPAPPQEKLYKIQPGDTLSVLAEKHLGSSRRYMDIYEANKDKLRNPDDIQIGMVLRIPPRVSFKNDRNPQANSRSDNAPPTKFDSTPSDLVPPPEEDLFQPFSRSPLTPGRRETDF